MGVYMSKERFDERIADGFWIPTACFIILVLMAGIHYWEGIFFKPDYKENNGSLLACSDFDQANALIKSLIVRDTALGPRFDFTSPVIVNGVEVCFSEYEEW